MVTPALVNDDDVVILNFGLVHKHIFHIDTAGSIYFQLAVLKVNKSAEMLSTFLLGRK